MASITGSKNIFVQLTEEKTHTSLVIVGNQIYEVLFTQFIKLLIIDGTSWAEVDIGLNAARMSV